jgi:hypothetical protein
MFQVAERTKELRYLCPSKIVAAEVEMLQVMQINQRGAYDSS